MPGGEAQAEAHARYKAKTKAARCVPRKEEAGIEAERDQYRLDPKRFLKELMPMTFSMDFAPCHDEVIDGMKHAILNGGCKSVALPRGSGKTSIAIGVAIWAMLFGHRRYIAVIASDQGAADKILQSIKTELWQSVHIGRLWPTLQEYWIRGEGHGQKFMHLLNEDSSVPLIKWGTSILKLPSVPELWGTAWNGAVLQTKGITSGVRGMQFKMTNGETIRPDLVLIDDPQTKESARSIGQTDMREEIIDGDVMGLAGPGKSIAAFMLCTVIEPGDLSERYLDKRRHGDWNGTRIPMIEAFPDATETLWEEYRIIYMKCLREGVVTDPATKFYLQNREAMDAGGKVYWEARKEKKDVSALQHAMNLRIKRGNAFMGEYQNQPIVRYSGRPYEIDEIHVMEKCNGIDRFKMPADANLIVTMTDINFSGLNTVVVASTNDALRYVVDYQTYPGNGKPLYDSKQEKKTASDMAAIARALDEHIPKIGSARYFRDGKLVAPDLVLIDCGNWMDLVFRWCAANAHKVQARMVYPSRGRSDSKYSPSQLVGQPGDGWHVADWKNRGKVLVHNADVWRMRMQQAFLIPTSIPGTVTMYGKNPAEHKRFADEVCAEVLDEYQEMTEGGNRFFKWNHKVGQKNDLGDSTVGCFVGLSYLGAAETGLAKVRKPPAMQRRKPPPKRRVSQLKI